ncbi:MAG: tetratricopeptide repeat protein [Bacteroidales bacterium]|nr:tetratricopeptide repeat protein [Bacteroidales bacterium]
MKLFTISELFANAFKNNHDNKKISELNFEDIINETWILREQNQHTKNVFSLRTSYESTFKIGNILSILFDVKKDDISNLCVNNVSYAKIIKDKDSIWEYDILEHYKEISLNDISNEKHHVFYNLIYRNPNDIQSSKDKSIFIADSAIMIHSCVGAKYKENAFYIDVTATLTPQPKRIESFKQDNSQLYKSFSIAYDIKSGKQASSEYNYIKESIDNKSTDFKTHITSREWILLNLLSPDIATEYYWGKKAYSESRYMDAILYFNNVYDVLCQKWYKNGLSQQEMSLLTECSFLIGFSYNDLKLYDKAYHYLELAGRSNFHTYKYKKEFINCLVNSKNLLSIIYLDDYLQDLKNIHEKERTEDDYNFFYFLLRRKAYILIEMEQYEDAEYILRRLLEKEPDNEIVLKELAFIQNKRKKDEEFINKSK